LIYFKEFKKFGKVLEFRLINAFFISISLGLLGPILITIKGAFLSTWVISLLALLTTLAVKANNYIVNNYSIDTLYKSLVIIHILFIVTDSLYFYEPAYMAIGGGIVFIFEIAIFSSYYIALTNHLTDNTPHHMKDFLISRNSVWADGAIIGSIIVTILSLLSTMKITIIIIITYNLLLLYWLMYNWNFYKRNIA